MSWFGLWGPNNIQIKLRYVYLRVMQSNQTAERTKTVLATRPSESRRTHTAATPIHTTRTALSGSPSSRCKQFRHISSGVGNRSRYIYFQQGTSDCSLKWRTRTADWRAHIACVPRLRQRQSFSCALLSQHGRFTTALPCVRSSALT
jgi:hypothetical protein